MTATRLGHPAMTVTAQGGTCGPSMTAMTLPSRMVAKSAPRDSAGYSSRGSGFPSPMLPNSKKQQQKTGEWFEVASIEYEPTQL